MSQRGSRSSRERRSAAISESLEQDDEDEAIRAAMTNSHARRGSMLSQKRWSSSEESNRPYSREIKNFPRKRDNIEDTETESADVRSNDERYRTERHARGKARYSDVRTSEERIATKSLGERRKRSKRVERRKLGERSRTVDRDRDRIDAGSSMRRYNGESSLTDKSRKREKNVSRANDEVPITEILKKAQENVRTKYEEPVPLPELTTDTIYIQGRSGFSAVKIDELRHALENDTTRATKGGMAEDQDFTEIQHTLIRVAITGQKFWKRAGLVFQGLLGGMALLHFMVINLFFDTSMEFVSNYSIFSEVYANISSFLIALCLISIFDKFDLARLDMDHLREIYTDHTKTVLTIPLYLITFALHQATLKMNDQLALVHYDIEVAWSNDTMSEDFLKELSNWQKITISKDLLAVFAWLFVALGTRDNMLLMHLESMEKYASDADSPT